MLFVHMFFFVLVHMFFDIRFMFYSAFMYLYFFNISIRILNVQNPKSVWSGPAKAGKSRKRGRGRGRESARGRCYKH